MHGGHGPPTVRRPSQFLDGFTRANRDLPPLYIGFELRFAQHPHVHNQRIHPGGSKAVLEE
jgi:hypothetical protein